MEKLFKLLMALMVLLITFVMLFGVGGSLAYSLSPSFRTWVNEFQFRRDVVDAETDYTNRKGVEDQARAMLANYNYAMQEYNSYKEFLGTDDKARAQRALDAKSNANKTVAAYNEYLTKNNYVFKGNLPSDIPSFLPYVE